MKKLLFFLSCLIWLSACNSEDKDLKALEQQYSDYWKKNTKPDINKAKVLDASFKEFFIKHPNDTVMPSLLFKDAYLNINTLQNSKEGMSLLDRLEKDYPKHWRVPDALFLQAFTYEEAYHNDELARKKYEEIIQKFPNHPYAEQARQNLKILGKDLNEWVKHLSDSLNKAK